MKATKNGAVYIEKATESNGGAFKSSQTNIKLKLPQLTVVNGTNMTTLATNEKVTTGELLMLVTTNENVTCVAGTVTGTNPYLTNISSGKHTTAPYHAYRDSTGDVDVDTSIANTVDSTSYRDESIVRESSSATTYSGNTDLHTKVVAGDTVVIDGKNVVVNDAMSSSISNELSVLAGSSSSTKLVTHDTIEQGDLASLVRTNKTYVSGDLGIITTNNEFDGYPCEFSHYNSLENQNMLTDTGDIGDWSDETDLPEKREQMGVVLTKNKIHLLGGSNWLKAIGPNYSIISAPIDSSGNIGSWSTTGTLPLSYKSHSTIVLENKVYLLGGSGTNSIVSAPIDSNGNLGSWSIVGVLPERRYYHGTAVIKNKVYLFGGYDNGVNMKSVISAPIDSSGNIGSWSREPDLPATRYFMGVAVIKNKVYLLGGEKTSSTIYAPIDSNGNLGSWTSGTSLPVDRYNFSTVVSKNKIYILGGRSSITISSCIAAPIDSNGNIGAWKYTPNLLRPTCYSEAVAVTKNKLYLLGGRDRDNTLKCVQSTSLDGWDTGYTGAFANNRSTTTQSADISSFNLGEAPDRAFLDTPSTYRPEGGYNILNFSPVVGQPEKCIIPKRSIREVMNSWTFDANNHIKTVSYNEIVMQGKVLQRKITSNVNGEIVEPLVSNVKQEV